MATATRKFWCMLVTLACLTALAVWAKPVAAADEPKADRARTGDAGLEPLTPEAEQAVEELRAAYAEDSEPIAMLNDILAGSRLGPGEGWFELAVAQNRFGWDYATEQYDSDGDGSVARGEFPGSDDDFDRLDTDGDRRLTAADFDWSASSLTRTPGLMLFYMADRDSNGKVTPEEFSGLFTMLDRGNRGYLALDDVRNEFQAPDRSGNDNRPDRPSRSTLVLGLQRQEIGSLQPGPALDDPAPDFTLNSLDGESVTLSDEIGEQPIVLIFGNFTCGPFRSQSGNIEKLYERYRDRAKFFLVYVREAHPSDGWWMQSNQRVDIDLSQPRTNEERFTVAQTCRRRLDLDLPFLVDTVDDAVGATYSGMPNRLYLIDSEGTIAFKNGRGPFGFKARELEQALVLLLNESNAGSE
ncbi:MAG: hypothetical protein DWQ34_21010 [Planctomycetota bacterium]|nr:MAG: hypothetical protein DWQ34_21010 [Planctomycetota bacterium]